MFPPAMREDSGFFPGSATLVIFHLPVLTVAVLVGTGGCVAETFLLTSS